MLLYQAPVLRTVWVLAMPFVEAFGALPFAVSFCLAGDFFTAAFSLDFSSPVGFSLVSVSSARSRMPLLLSKVYQENTFFMSDV